MSRSQDETGSGVGVTLSNHEEMTLLPSVDSYLQLQFGRERVNHFAHRMSRANAEREAIAAEEERFSDNVGPVVLSDQGSGTQ